MVSDAQMRATQKYEKNNYVKIMLRIRKDSGILEEVKKYCERYGLSQNSAFVNAVVYCIRNDIDIKK